VGPMTTATDETSCVTRHDRCCCGAVGLRVPHALLRALGCIAPTASTAATFSLSASQPAYKQTSWSESARELHRPSDCRLSAKSVPTFADRGVSLVSAADPLQSSSWFSSREPLLFPSSSFSVLLMSGPGSRPTIS
jgi:hypothetical protein